MFESLHNHTNISDGTMTHRELLVAARKHGARVIAFTDHENLPSQETLDDLACDPVPGVEWIVGIEISSGLPRELGGKADSGFHIIGLFLDHRNAELRAYCRRAQEARKRRMAQMVKNLQGIGFTITEADCLAASGGLSADKAGETVGRPHIVSALRAHPENEAVFARLTEEMRKAGERDAEIGRRYRVMMQKGEREVPYALFLSLDSFRKGVYAEYESLGDMDAIVGLIRGAGGIACVAHYPSVKRRIPLELLERLLREKRLDGAEVVFGLRAQGTDDEPEMEADRAALRALVARTGCVASGGADAHREEDLRAFAASPLAVASRGLLAGMRRR